MVEICKHDGSLQNTFNNRDLSRPASWTWQFPASKEALALRCKAAEPSRRRLIFAGFGGNMDTTRHDDLPAVAASDMQSAQLMQPTSSSPDAKLVFFSFCETTHYHCSDCRHMTS